MENSKSSSANKSLMGSRGGPTAAPPEESGWTAYFQDSFLSNNQSSSCDDDDDDDDDDDHSPSLISDAASPHAAWKVSNSTRFAPAFPFAPPMNNIPRRLNFKKKKAAAAAKALPYDDSLEDTASSPVNSPKVSSMKHEGLNPRKTTHDHNIENPLGKGGGSDHHLWEMETNERNEMNLDGNINEHCVNLKKRGLCLVPLSMLTNYLP